MALNNCGPIAIGGCTSGVSIAKELGLTTTAQHSLNCTSYRNLSGQSSGAVSMNAFHGKSSVTVPGAPTIGTATATSCSAISVSFTAPSCTGGSPITGYQAVCTSSGTHSATGSSSPISVTGLSPSTSYTFHVRAQNSVGYGSYSGNASATTQSVRGCMTFCGARGTTRLYNWTVPSGVTSISVVSVGGGSGGTYGPAGALAYYNNLSVTPGATVTIHAGSGGHLCVSQEPTSSYITYGGSNYAVASGNRYWCQGSSYSCATGGGAGAYGTSYGWNGGMGAGGYTGSGGKGAQTYGTNSIAGTGGGGGGGGSGYFCGCGNQGGAGGGVGLHGQGSNGYAGAMRPLGGGGGGGSGGGNGSCVTVHCCNCNLIVNPEFGGNYGGSVPHACICASYGGIGGVRIVYPGTSRQFPTTCVS